MQTPFVFRLICIFKLFLSLLRYNIVYAVYASDADLDDGYIEKDISYRIVCLCTHTQIYIITERVIADFYRMSHLL